MRPPGQGLEVDNAAEGGGGDERLNWRRRTIHLGGFRRCRCGRFNVGARLVRALPLGIDPGADKPRPYGDPSSGRYAQPIVNLTHRTVAAMASTRAATGYNRAITSGNRSFTRGTRRITPATRGITRAIRAITPANPIITSAIRAITPAIYAITPANPAITPATRVITSADRVITRANPAITSANPTITPATRTITRVDRTITSATRTITRADRAITRAISIITRAIPVITRAISTITRAIQTITPGILPNRPILTNRPARAQGCAARFLRSGGTMQLNHGCSRGAQVARINTDSSALYQSPQAPALYTKVAETAKRNLASGDSSASLATLV